MDGCKFDRWLLRTACAGAGVVSPNGSVSAMLDDGVWASCQRGVFRRTIPGIGVELATGRRVKVPRRAARVWVPRTVPGPRLGMRTTAGVFRVAARYLRVFDEVSIGCDGTRTLLVSRRESLLAWSLLSRRTPTNTFTGHGLVHDAEMPVRLVGGRFLEGVTAIAGGLMNPATGYVGITARHVSFRVGTSVVWSECRSPRSVASLRFPRLATCAVTAGLRGMHASPGALVRVTIKPGRFEVETERGGNVFKAETRTQVHDRHRTPILNASAVVYAHDFSLAVAGTRIKKQNRLMLSIPRDDGFLWITSNIGRGARLRNLAV